MELAVGALRPVVLVSDLAIGVEQGDRFVLVLDANNVVQPRPVRLGGTLNGLRIVESGLRPGERVILKGLAGPGMKVQPRIVPMAAQGTRAAQNEGAAR